jgi:hypothetical protein
MDVSHFELIFKPQSPSTPVGAPNVERVLQGYFLEITNLENTEYLYELEFVATPVTDPNRSLAGNTLVFYDTPGTNNAPGVLNGALTSEVFTPSNGFIRVPPRGTALVAVLPSAFGPSPLDPTPITTPTFEVRGYVRLKLPSLFQAGGPGSFFRRVPQAQAPVRVLLTPQFRSTFFAANGAITDQIQATVPTASGKGENLVPPEPGGRIVLTPPVFTGIPILPDRIRASIGIESQMMASMLAELDPDSDLRGFNAALEKAGVPYAIERRKGK